MSHKILWTLVVTALMSAVARADLVVRNDGKVFEGQVLSQNDQEVVFLPDQSDASATEHISKNSYSRLLITDAQGALLKDSAPPRPVMKFSAPADPVAPPILAAPKGPSYYLIPLHGEVGETVLADALEKSLADAEKRHPTVVVLDIDSPGGMVDESRQIINILHRYNKKLRIVALTSEDLSAAAVFTLSVKEIYVKSSSTIGAATSYMPSNLLLPPKLEEKMQSAWRATARNSAEEGGHDPQLADAMIDDDRELHWETVGGKPVIKEGPGDHMVSRKGKVLTLTSHEAVDCGLASGEADDLDELASALKLDKWTEIKGLGTLLADSLPKRLEAYKAAMDNIGTDFAKDLASAQKDDPSQTVTTVTHIVNVPGPNIMQPGIVAPGVPYPPGFGRRGRGPVRPFQPGLRGGGVAPQRPPTVTQTVARPTSAWEGDSLKCVVDLQQIEVDINDSIALSNAYGRTAEVALLKELLVKVADVRATILSNRNRYNILPAGALKTGVAGKMVGTNFVTITPAGLPLLGFDAHLNTMESFVYKLEPLFAVPPDPGHAPSRRRVIAKSEWLRRRWIVGRDANNDHIIAIKIIFISTKKGGADLSDTYTSDWIGKTQRPTRNHRRRKGRNRRWLHGI